MARVTNAFLSEELGVGNVIKRGLSANYLIKNMIAPSEVADMVAFLCGSSEAAISGSPIMMDAGSTIS